MSHNFHDLQHFFERYDQRYIFRATLLLLCAILSVTPTHAMSPRHTAATSSSTCTETTCIKNPNAQQPPFERFQEEGSLTQIQCKFISGNSVYFPTPAKHAKSEDSSESDAKSDEVAGFKPNGTARNPTPVEYTSTADPRSFYPSLSLPSPARVFASWLTSLSKSR